MVNRATGRTVVGLLWLTAVATGCTVTPSTDADQISRVWFDNRALRGTDHQLLVAHAELRLAERGTRRYSLTIRLFDTTGEPLRSSDGLYCLKGDRQIGATEVVDLHGRASPTQGMSVGIPYTELELPAGYHRLIAQLEARSFHHGGPVAVAQTEVELRIDGPTGEVLWPAEPTAPYPLAIRPTPAGAQPGMSGTLVAPTGPDSGVYWFVRGHAPHSPAHDRLVGPSASRREAVACRSGPRDHIMAVTGRDPVWVFESVHPTTGRRLGLLGPFATLRAAEQAHRRLQHAAAGAQRRLGPIRQWTVRQCLAAPSP